MTNTSWGELSDQEQTAGSEQGSERKASPLCQAGTWAREEVGTEAGLRWEPKLCCQRAGPCRPGDGPSTLDNGPCREIASLSTLLLPPHLCWAPVTALKTHHLPKNEWCYPQLRVDTRGTGSHEQEAARAQTEVDTQEKPGPEGRGSQAEHTDHPHADRGCRDLRRMRTIGAPCWGWGVGVWRKSPGPDDRDSGKPGKPHWVFPSRRPGGDTKGSGLFGEGSPTAPG